MKKIIKQLSVFILSVAIIIGDTVPVLADNSTADVYATQGTSFSVTILKTLVLDGNTGNGAYTVSVKGNISGTDVITVAPDKSFNMKQSGKSDILTTIEQPKTTFTYADGMTIDNPISEVGHLTMASISAGKWSGVFNFNLISTVDTSLKNSIGSVASDITNTTKVGQDVSQEKETVYSNRKSASSIRVEGLHSHMLRHGYP